MIYRRAVSCLHDALQAPVRRGEERFSLNQPIWMFAASGALSTGRIKDISLSGVAIAVDEDRALTSKIGEHVRVFIAEVEFVAATVVRRTGRLLAVQFDLPPCVERDLLIRKLFTTELDPHDSERLSVLVDRSFAHERLVDGKEAGRRRTTSHAGIARQAAGAKPRHPRATRTPTLGRSGRRTINCRLSRYKPCGRSSEME